MSLTISMSRVTSNRQRAIDVFNSYVSNGCPLAIRIYFPGITLTEDDISADGGITIRETINPDTNYRVGRATSTEVAISFINDPKFIGFDWTAEFQLQIRAFISGAVDDNGQPVNDFWEMANVGYFKGKTPEQTDLSTNEIIEFVAYDRMQRFNILADDFIDSVSYPATLNDIFISLCSYANVPTIVPGISNDVINFFKTYQFAENPFPYGITLRDILSIIAEANAAYVKIRDSGQVTFERFASAVYPRMEFDSDDYLKFTYSGAFESIGSVVISDTTNQDNYIYDSGDVGKAYRFVDNPLLVSLSAEDKETVAASLLFQVSYASNYRPVKIALFGNYAITSGDLIYVTDLSNETIPVRVYSTEKRFNGSLITYIESTGYIPSDELSYENIQRYKEGGKFAEKAQVGRGTPKEPQFSSVHIGSSSGADTLSFGGGIPNSNNYNNAGGIIFDVARRRYTFRTKGTVNGKNESFILPENSDNNANEDFEIFNTKANPKANTSDSGTGVNTYSFTVPYQRHALLFYAGHITSIFNASTSATTVYSGGEDPSTNGFTLTKAANSNVYTITRTNGNHFFAGYIII